MLLQKMKTLGSSFLHVIISCYYISPHGYMSQFDNIDLLAVLVGLYFTGGN